MGFSAVEDQSQAKFAAFGVTCQRVVPVFLTNPEISLKSDFWQILALRKLEHCRLLAGSRAITILNAHQRNTFWHSPRSGNDVP